MAKIIKVRGLLPEIVYGRGRCIRIIFTAGSLSSGNICVPSNIASTYGPSPKAPISEYNQGSSRNGQAPSSWWYFFTFSAIMIFSSGVLSMIYSVLL